LRRQRADVDGLSVRDRARRFEVHDALDDEGDGLALAVARAAHVLAERVELDEAAGVLRREHVAVLDRADDGFARRTAARDDRRLPGEHRLVVGDDARADVQRVHLLGELPGVRARAGLSNAGLRHCPLLRVLSSS
jgi:hypothetical protein